MNRRPPRATTTYTLLPFTRLFRVAGVHEPPGYPDPLDFPEPRRMQICPQEHEGQPDIVEVVGIDLAAEHHAHDMETPATIDLGMGEEAAERVEIRHAHHQRAARPQHPIPLLQELGSASCRERVCP